MSKLDYSGLYLAWLGLGLLLLGLSAATPLRAERGPPMEPNIKKITPVIFTDDVDGCTTFWIERLGFELTMSVPAQQAGQGANQFALISDGNLELMYQSFASVDEDLPGAVEPVSKPNFTLFVEVEDRSALMARMDGLSPEVTPRETFYGALEVGYRSPCNTLVVFAEFPERPSE